MNRNSLTLRVLVASFIAIHIVACGRSSFTNGWPAGSGYVDAPKHKPSEPHEVESSTTKATVIDVQANETSVAPGSNIDLRLVNGEMKDLIVYPGAVLTVATESGESLHMKDFNGDDCVLPNEITVTVDAYGQFVPIAGDP